MRLLLLSLLVGLTGWLPAQTVLLTEDFEDATVNYTPSITEFSDGFGDYFIRTDGSDIGSFIEFTGTTGSFFAAHDIDGEGATLPVSLTLSPITITGFDIITLSLDIAEDDDGGSQDWDGADYFRAFYSIDGGAEVLFFAVESEVTGTNGAPRIDDNLDGLGEGTEITDAFANFSVPFNNTGGDNLTIRFEFFLNSGDEDIAIDNVEVSGTMANSNGICDVIINPATASFVCQANTGADDDVEFSISYTGVELGYTVSITPVTPGAPPATITGDDPGLTADGTISAIVQEGATYTLSFGGGDCTNSSLPIQVPALCLPPPPSVVINEVLPDATGDNNQDGTISATEDEFVEVYNTATTPTDISGWTIMDNSGTRHTFAAGTILEPMQGLVVFGGGTPPNAPCFVLSNGGGLQLANGGDQVILSDDTGAQRDAFSYSNTVDNVSFAREVDGTGNFVQHTDIASNPVDNSPCLSNNVPGELLPVELTTFTAAADAKNNVRLHWATAREENSDRFEVQWSADGVRFATLETLAAANTSFGADYALLDERGVTGMNYYRLRQVDFDGREEFFGPVVVELTGGELNVFPNPTTDLLNVRGVDAGATTEVLDLNGRVVLRAPMNGGGISVAALPSGTYLLRVRDARASRTVRFVRR